MKFVVIAKDGADEEAMNRRMAAREAHIADFKTGLEAEQNILGGAILDDSGNMCGSVMVVEFDDRAALDEWINNDPYVTGNVWQDIEVLPFKLAGKS